MVVVDGVVVVRLRLGAVATGVGVVDGYAAAWPRIVAVGPAPSGIPNDQMKSRDERSMDNTLPRRFMRRR